MEKNHWIAVVASFAAIGLLWELYNTSEYSLGTYQHAYIDTVWFRNIVDGVIERNEKESRVSYNMPGDDSYEFLYGEEFEKALDRAEKRPKKTILFLRRDGNISWAMSMDLPRECGGCLVRNDKRMITNNSIEAIIFHYAYTTSQQISTVKRNPYQYWIWLCLEAPPVMNRNKWLNVADKVGFNLTVTYRKESDFFRNYELPIPNLKLKNPLKTKKYLAFTAVSNCDRTPGAIVRLQYLKEIMKKGLRLTAIGKCFGNRSIAKQEKDKMIQITSQYKFYFAFENSYHCKDYITEKFFRALQAGVVPVVWGATKEAYESYIPSSGFIFVDDFPSMQSLIDYLYYLDENDTAYLEYYRWRQIGNHSLHYENNTFTCPICRFLHGINTDDAYKVPYKYLKRNQSFISDPPGRKIVSSIRKWWLEGDNSDCYQKNLQLDENGRIVVT